MARALTGTQASGELHLGNYLGAIRPAMELQRDYEAFYFIADYHSLTSVREPKALLHSTMQIAATFLALGLDVNKHCLFRQSAVVQVQELAWILACNMSAGTLDRGHAVKAAADDGREINAGTVFYPVLMAADILLYDANVVPVGPDQKQHLEITRDVAQSINHHFGEGTLVVPEVHIAKDVGLIIGTDGRKMSKSYGNVISLWQPKKKMRKQIMKIKTDSKTMEEPKDPNTCEVFRMYKLFATEPQVAELAERYRAGGMGYGHAKQALFEAIEAELAEPRERYNELMADQDQLLAILKQGEERARVYAEQTMKRVRARVGLR